MSINLYNGDCISVMQTLENDSVDLIITDPPYNLANFMKDRQTNLSKMRENFFGSAGWDEFEDAEWEEKMDLFFEHSNRLLKSKGALIVFMSLLRVETLVKIAQKHNFYYKTTGVWHKTNPMPRNMNLHFINSIEGWVYFINDGRTGTFNNNGKAIHDFIETSLTPSTETEFGRHPTQKPESLFKHFVELLSNPGETVLDPFMGSGTAGVVSQILDRNFIGIELTEQYFTKAKKRIEQTNNNKQMELSFLSEK